MSLIKHFKNLVFSIKHTHTVNIPQHSAHPSLPVWLLTANYIWQEKPGAFTEVKTDSRAYLDAHISLLKTIAVVSCTQSASQIKDSLQTVPRFTINMSGNAELMWQVAEDMHLCELYCMTADGQNTLNELQETSANINWRPLWCYKRTYPHQIQAFSG